MIRLDHSRLLQLRFSMISEVQGAHATVHDHHQCLVVAARPKGSRTLSKSNSEPFPEPNQTGKNGMYMHVHFMSDMRHVRQPGE